jgi:hypothetical protein
MIDDNQEPESIRASFRYSSIAIPASPRIQSSFL